MAADQAFDGLVEIICKDVTKNIGRLRHLNYNIAFAKYFEQLKQEETYQIWQYITWIAKKQLLITGVNSNFNLKLTIQKVFEVNWEFTVDMSKYLRRRNK